MVIRHDDWIIDRENMTIVVGSRVHNFNQCRKPHSYSKFNNISFEIIARLLINGWTRKQDLFDLIWGDDPNGGPLAGTKILDIRFHQWKPNLQKMGLQIVRDKRGGVIWYKIASDLEHE